MSKTSITILGGTSMEKLDRYIGTKVIVARPMTRLEYNDFRNWTLPNDENPSDEGYIIEDTIGYITWSPKSTFESAYRNVSGPLKDLEHDLLTNNYTNICHEKDFRFDVPHDFEVYTKDERLVGYIHFQEGSITEHGVNGVFDQDVIAMVIHRLKSLNQSESRSRDNAMAINKLEEAWLWLTKGTMGRNKRGEEETYNR